MEMGLNIKKGRVVIRLYLMNGIGQLEALESFLETYLIRVKLLGFPKKFEWKLIEYLSIIQESMTCRLSPMKCKEFLITIRKSKVWLRM